MLIPNKFNGYVDHRRTCHTGMEPVLLSAALGGGARALKGGDMGDILESALLAGATGGVGGQLLGTALAGPAELASVGADAASGALAGATPVSGIENIIAGPGYEAASLGATSTPISMGESISRSFLPEFNQGALQALSDTSGSGGLMGLDFGALNSAGLDPASLNLAEVGQSAAVAPASTQAGIPSLLSDPSAASKLYGTPGASPSTFGQPASKVGFMDSPTQWWKSLSPAKQLALGAGAGGLGLMALSNRDKIPGQAPYSGALSRFRFNPDTYQAATVPTRMASGGIADLGSYSDGGRLLKGPGDGMSDHIPATIANKRPARLADGEFVVPADVVSHLGNGSTDAGAKQLYSMMDRVRKARTGRKAQGKQIRPQKLMVA